MPCCPTASPAASGAGSSATMSMDARVLSRITGLPLAEPKSDGSTRCHRRSSAAHYHNWGALRPHAHCDVATLPRHRRGLTHAQAPQAGGHVIAAFAPLVRASTRRNGGVSTRRAVSAGGMVGRAGRTAHSEREHTMANSSWLAISAARAVTGVAVAFGLHLAISGAALAQQGKQAEGQQQSAWVKLCEKAPLASRDKEGKLVREEKEICLTHHERLDGNTGMVIVSAALRHVEGIDKEHLMIMVPLGMAIPPGVRAAVYTPEQWEKAQKNEKIDEDSLKPISLNYT